MLEEEHATMPLVGGLMTHGYQCGMLWGAVLGAGAQAYQRYGSAVLAQTMSVVAAQRLVESFGNYNKGEINCLEISELNLQGKIQFKPILKFFIKGGPIHCINMAVKYGPLAFNDINAVFVESTKEILSPPVSCAALLAQKMGMSDLHTTMVAGFAGGIGLSGGGCGALGATIWASSLKSIHSGANNKSINNAASNLINEFIKGSEYKLECEEIVGRKFENVTDHARYLQSGGCAEIIELLTEKTLGG